MTSSNMTSYIIVVILIAEQRDGISINVNCIKTTLMTVNRELVLAVKKRSKSQNAHFRYIGQNLPGKSNNRFQRILGDVQRNDDKS